ncbi:MAG: biopolymer transporter ExbD [Treponema sp.]|nr:biopolymer transporter ExbD [Treponema sp.]
MKIGRKRAGRGFAVPTSATSDIAFLLLIFIMVVALINYRVEVGIEYARAATVRNTGAELNLEVWIDRDGSLYLDGLPTSLPAVEEAVIDLLLHRPGTQVHVIADRNTAFANVNAVIEVLQLLQYRTVSFVVRNVP